MPVSKKNIAVVEAVHFGQVHLQINTAMLLALAGQHADATISFYAEQQHAKEVQKFAEGQLDHLNIKTFKAYSKEHSKWFWFQKIAGEWYQMFRACLWARHEKPDMLVWTSLFPTGFLMLCIWSYLLLPKQQQLLVLHGEMEYFNSSKKRWVECCLRAVLRAAFYIAPHRLKFLVLGEHIYNNIMLLPVSSKERIDFIEHPVYIPGWVKHYKRQTNKAPFVVSTFGSIAMSKSADRFIALAKDFEREIAEGRIVFRLVGKIYPAVHKPAETGRVSYIGSPGFTDYRLYMEAILESDLVVFFYGNEHYKYTASGVISECIVFGIPFISTPNDYVEAMQKKYPQAACFVEEAHNFASVIHHKLAAER